MLALEYLRALIQAIGVQVPNEVLLQLLIDEAKGIFTDITNRKAYDKYPQAIARIAFYNFQRIGDESKNSYSAGGVSVNYADLKTALKNYLPLPLIKIGGIAIENEGIDMRSDFTKPLIVRIVSELPISVDGSVVYNKTDMKYYGGANGVWKDLSGTIDYSNIDYNLLENKPIINGQVLQGEMTIVGEKGKDGTDGVSPTVIVATNTDTEYILSITDVNGVITTPNLKGKDGTGTGGTNGTTVTTGGVAQTTWETNTKANISDIPTKVSQLANDNGYITTVDIPTIPTLTSQLTNDSGFINNTVDNLINYYAKLQIDEKFVQKENGKRLSTNDFTNVDKNKLNEIEYGANKYILPMASATTLGGIKVDNDTITINTNGVIVAKASGGTGGTDNKQDKPTTDNTAYGVDSLSLITTGTHNTAIGYSNLRNSKTARYNTGIGLQNLISSEGLANTGVGWNNLGSCNGEYNLALGYNNLTAKGTFKECIGIGSGCLTQLLSNYYNIAIGKTVLDSLLNGTGNIGVGYSSATALKSGNYNTVLGHNALVGKVGDTGNVENVSNCTALGANSSVSATNQVQLGDSETTTYCYGAINNRSDKRDKADIQDTSLGLTFINSLRAVEFKWDYRDDYFKDELQKDGIIKKVPIPKDGSKKRNRPHQGFIAQEVKKVIDDLNVDFGGYQDHSIKGGCDVLSLGYEEFIAPMVKAIQEQQKMIDNLKLKVELLQSK